MSTEFSKRCVRDAGGRPITGECKFRGLTLYSRTTNLLVEVPEEQGRPESRIEEYLRKTVVLKKIMSNKARVYRRVNATQNTLTVVVTSLLLFIGFSGSEKIRTYISWVCPVSGDAADLIYNLPVFFLFVIGVLHLVFRFSEKQSSAEEGVAALAALANEIEDAVTARDNLVIAEAPARIDLIRARYEAIAENVPANTDREYRKAKQSLAQKASRRSVFSISPGQLFDGAEQERIVTSIALGSRQIVDVLRALREEGPDLFLGGGMIRSAVWDYLHRYASPTVVDDVDVIHFNRDRTEKSDDEAICQRLRRRLPNARWSVKNQARMHIVNGEEPYVSLDDAVSRWPETATAFVARLTEQGTIEFIAPYRFDDLLRLLVVNTPSFVARTDVVRGRIAEKNWIEIWPQLKVLLTPPAGGG